MELFIFARFHAQPDKQSALEDLLREQVPKTRAEPGCLSIDAYRSVRDPGLFWIHSRWTDEASFEIHADLANTVSFVAAAERLIDHPFDVARSHVIT